jgi:hypothetical protein
MTANVQRDRLLLPELDALVADTADRQLDELAGALAQGVAGVEEPPVATLALVRLALEFSTWRRLTLDGLSDADAASLMTRSISRA